MKKRLLNSLSLLLMVLMLFPGCQQGTAQTSQTGLWRDKELELYLSQFGVPLEQSLENLGISKDGLTEGNHGEWILPQSREMDGMEFSQMLSVFDKNSDYDDEGFDWKGFNHDGTIYRIDLTYLGRADEGNTVDQLLEKGIALAVQAKELYGTPSTYPGLEQRIFDDEGNLKGEKYSSYKEEWQVSEDVTMELSIYCDSQGMMLRLTYIPDIVQEYALFGRTRDIK